MAARRPRVVIVGGPDVDARLELMDRLRGDFDFAAVGSEPALAERFVYPYRTYRLSRRFDLLADLRSTLELRRIFRELAPDLVHCFDTKPAIVGRLGARLAGVPAIVGTLPGLGALYTYRTPQVRRRRKVIERLHRLAARCSDRTVFQNRDDLEELVSRGVVPRAKSLLIPGSGVARERFEGVADDPELRRRARAELGIEPGAEVVLMASRLLRSKGVLDLAAAAPHLRKLRPRAKILIAGPEDPETLDALTAEELAEVDRHTRRLGPRRDVPALLAAADVLAFPSYYREGVPRILIEAALAGVPIVAADAVGAREVVEDGKTGLRVPTRQPEALAGALARLLGEPEIGRALARAARERALERFELGAIAEAHRRLYLELTAAAKPPRRP